MIIHDFEYNAPSTIDEVVSLLNKDPGAAIIAGGSDVMPQLKTDVIAPSILLDLKNINELKKVEAYDDNIYIGSMVTLSSIGENKTILENVPAISEAARTVASPQIRNRGTIGGNILQARRCLYYNQTKRWREGMDLCYKVGGDICIQIPKSTHCRAIYYSDIATALLALNAKVEVYSAGCMLEIKDIKEVVDNHSKDLSERFLLGRFIIPVQNKRSWNKFVKYSLRGSIDFPIINFAVNVQEKQCKIFVGAIATTVIELTDTEKYIEENKTNLSKEKIVEVAVKEMNSKNEIVREVGLSINVKKSSFNLIEEVVDEMIVRINKLY